MTTTWENRSKTRLCATLPTIVSHYLTWGSNPCLRGEKHETNYQGHSTGL